jgi:tRNA acetyltransferase TAN1
LTYKIELRVRNHTTIPRLTLIQNVAQCVPEGHTVDLENPRIFILVEVFKSICGVSVVEDYYKLQKFNVMEIANKKKRADQAEESGSRVAHNSKSAESKKGEGKGAVGS